MSTYKLYPTIHIPSRDAVAAWHVLQVWEATGAVPAAHIVAEPETEEEDLTTAEPVAA